MTRRQAREQAFELVFQMNFQDASVKELTQVTAETAEPTENSKYNKYALQIAEIVKDKQEEIDKKIEEHSKKWKLNRLPKVTVSILRLAVAEIDYQPDTPPAAVINEAVELAKKFGDEDDWSYVNGVLGGYVRAKSAKKEEE